jgi:diaminohydroxyphosphoribosylaminopyrimidine deaminase / 5-amino-6-(5-phosphoribosylamino)uracil reductase
MFKKKYFKLAYDLAEQGRGKCSPNPFVGAVIVKDGKIIGQGFTQPYGLDHAEVQAIKDAGNCQGAEMYVTLEPCAHFGKTPPCADAIVKAGIYKVYAGIKDPNEKVNGKGFAKLKDAGIEVEYGIGEDKINRQLEYYITYITQQRPFVFMKNAVSKDGKIALSGGVQTQITGEETRKRVHELRNEADVLLTGIGTVLADDPMLNVRIKPSERLQTFRTVDDAPKERKSTIPSSFDSAQDDKVLNPTRVILDTNLQIPIESEIVQTAKDIETIVFTRQDFQDEQDKIAELKTFGVEVVKTSYSKNGLDLKTVLNELYNRNFYSVMVEAGSKVCSSFVREKLVDKFYRFVSPKIIGGDFSLFKELNITEMQDVLNLKTESVEKSGEDILIIGYPI